jgi:hypothetical protein
MGKLRPCHLQQRTEELILEILERTLKTESDPGSVQKMNGAILVNRFRSVKAKMIAAR